MASFDLLRPLPQPQIPIPLALNDRRALRRIAVTISDDKICIAPIMDDGNGGAVVGLSSKNAVHVEGAGGRRIMLIGFGALSGAGAGLVGWFAFVLRKLGIVRPPTNRSTP